jgi:hypothetical protein
MAKVAREHLSAWEGFRVEAEEYRELDEERVLVLVHRTARGETSGLQLGQVGSKGAQLFHLRDGKVTRYVTWTTANAPSPTTGSRSSDARRGCRADHAHV